MLGGCLSARIAKQGVLSANDSIITLSCERTIGTAKYLNFGGVTGGSTGERSTIESTIHAGLTRIEIAQW